MGVYSSKRGFYYRFMKEGKVHEAHYRTKQEAVTGEHAKKAELGGRHIVSAWVATGEPTSESPVLFTDAVRKYLVGHVIGTLASAHKVERSLGLFTCLWGSRTSAQVTSAEVQGWVQARRKDRTQLGRPIKGATINRDLEALSAFYQWAQGAGLVPTGYNPAHRRSVKRSEEPWRAFRTLDREQIGRLLQLAPNPEERAKAALLVLTGQRLGVILGLRWEQVDLTSALLTYRSKRQDRTIPLSPEALGVLHGLGPQPSGYVFPNRAYARTQRWWARARVLLGVPDLRRHDMRVTFARTLASQGVDLVTIRDSLGHTSVVTTQRYIPGNLGMVRQAMAQMGQIVGTVNGTSAIVASAQEDDGTGIRRSRSSTAGETPNRQGD